MAWFGRTVATGLLEVSHDIASLDGSGRWAVVVDFEGQLTAARFARWEPCEVDGRDLGPLLGSWRGPRAGQWRTSLTRTHYLAAVSSVRDHIAAGQVYQANICRVLRAPLPDPGRADVLALGRALHAGNPAPHSGVLRLPEHGIHIASASPELFLRRSRRALSSRPIKGTGRTAADLLDKDFAENVMIVDLVRNDLAHVCVPGSVSVPALLRLEEHPGLVHLVSEVTGHLADGVGWPEIMAATFPPGSVTGAPKIAACQIIADLEDGPRGPYCGAFGWVDADAGTASLAVAIRTFWVEPGPTLAFGAGAGITWGSDPLAEWEETELKAARLLGLAGGSTDPDSGQGVVGEDVGHEVLGG